MMEVFFAHLRQRWLGKGLWMIPMQWRRAEIQDKRDKQKRYKTKSKREKEGKNVGNSGKKRGVVFL